MDDTICAIATSIGSSAISIIRVSGQDAIKIVNTVFKGKDLTTVNSHTINYGHIIDGDKIIDEVLVSVMKAPKTYTMEDVVEINTHGGYAPTKEVFELLLKNGCRIAESGEFTKRAFLNGRIDLTQADAVMDKINAKTSIQNKLSQNSLSGKVSNLINELRDDMIQIISNINVNIDYPEYDDVDIITNEVLIPKVTKLKERIKKILEESQNGKIIKDGIMTSIIGKPNVGKSSLLNALLEEEKAIVTDIAGTTRDTVEGQIIIDGILLNIIDTAGIRKTTDKVESIGVEKSISMIEKSDLILFMLNNNEEIDNETIELLDKIKEKKYIIIVNKTDLDNKLKLDKLDVDKSNVINMSLKENIGIDKLKNRIIELFNINELEEKDPTYITNSRSIAILNDCLKDIEAVEEGLNTNQTIDMLELDIRSIWEKLGLINGSTYEEELLDEMFKRFCLGK